MVAKATPAAAGLKMLCPVPPKGALQTRMANSEAATTIGRSMAGGISMGNAVTVIKTGHEIKRRQRDDDVPHDGPGGFRVPDIRHMVK